jgi:hypothetical protein
VAIDATVPHDVRGGVALHRLLGDPIEAEEGLAAVGAQCVPCFARERVREAASGAPRERIGAVQVRGLSRVVIADALAEQHAERGRQGDRARGRLVVVRDLDAALANHDYHLGRVAGPHLGDGFRKQSRVE